LHALVANNIFVLIVIYIFTRAYTTVLDVKAFLILRHLARKKLKWIEFFSEISRKGKCAVIPVLMFKKPICSKLQFVGTNFSDHGV
jgi:hypothetical protein